MKKCVLSIIVITIFSILATLFVSSYLRGDWGLPGDFEKRTIFSNLLGEKRELIIAVPASYERAPDRLYPVLYVLSGPTLTFHAAELIDLMARIDAMPETIVVGLPSPSEESRRRDCTPPFMLRDLGKRGSELGAADAFLSFIEREVIPYIEGEYRTSSPRMALGHSRAGLCVMYSLMANTELFHARFVHSPPFWRENGAFVSELEAFLSENPALNAFVYMSMGDGEHERMLRAYDAAVEALKNNAPKGLRWHAQITAGAGHGDNAFLAAPAGFSRYFEDPLEAESP